MSFTRRAMSFALVFGACLATTIGAQGTAQKFAYINSQVVMERAPGRATAEEAFRKEMAPLQEKVQKMGDSLNAAVTAYGKEEATLSAADKETRQKALREKEEQYQTEAREFQQKAQQRQYELMQPIMDQIRDVIDDIRAKEGFAFIFDAGAQGGVIVAADRNLDITEKVIARLKPIPVAASGTPRPDTATKAAPGAPRASPAGVTRPKPSTQ